MEPTRKITKITMTFDGETREVEAYTWGDDFAHGVHTDPIFVATVGRGIARYPASVRFSLVTDGKIFAGCTKVFDNQGNTFQYHLQTSVRNRPARIVGWADSKGITNYADQTRNA